MANSFTDMLLPDFLGSNKYNNKVNPPRRIPGTTSPADTGQTSPIVSEGGGDVFGMNPFSFAAIAGRLATALAPERFNSSGQRVPSWQEKLGVQANQIAQGQMMANALKSSGTGTGGINTLLLLRLLSGGGGL